MQNSIEKLELLNLFCAQFPLTQNKATTLKAKNKFCFSDYFVHYITMLFIIYVRINLDKCNLLGIFKYRDILKYIPLHT